MAQRNDLSKPLPFPFILYVEPTNVCNYKCGICPESLEGYGSLAGYYERMTWNTWWKIQEHIVDAGWRLKVIRFFHTGEPLLNRELFLMIRVANHHCDKTEVTTNGSVLTEEIAERLVNSELSYIRISVYGTNEEGYQNETGQARFTLKQLLKNVAFLRHFRDATGRSKPHIFAQLVSTDPHYLEFEKQWRSIADTWGQKELFNWGGDTFVQLGQHPTPAKLVCPFPFYELAIKSNGDVTVCCVDWANKLKVGNVHSETLREIWAGPALRGLRETQLRGERFSILPCRDCNLVYATPDNMDHLVKAPVSVHT